jgi:hypothetical protein
MLIIFFFALVGIFTSITGASSSAIKKACEYAAKYEKKLSGKAKDVYIKNCISAKSKKSKSSKSKSKSKTGKSSKSGDSKSSKGKSSSRGGKDAGKSGSYTLASGGKVHYGTKVWQWYKKVLGTWKGPKNAKYMIYTTYYADTMEESAFLGATHRGVSKIEHKGDPCLYDTRALNEQKRGYRYMKFYEIKGTVLHEVQELKFEDLKWDPPSKKCYNINLPEMTE